MLGDGLWHCCSHMSHFSMAIGRSLFSQQDESIRVAVLSITAAGTGLTLTVRAAGPAGPGGGLVDAHDGCLQHGFGVLGTSWKIFVLRRFSFTLLLSCDIHAHAYTTHVHIYIYIYARTIAYLYSTGSHQQPLPLKLVGGLEHFLFSRTLGIIIPTDQDFSEGFKPPTRKGRLPLLFQHCTRTLPGAPSKAAQTIVFAELYWVRRPENGQILTWQQTEQQPSE